ncbi:MAG TPA: GatB/YqeY domain-containing protein [Chloroflexota bacterium]|nr:GatB/YqeY domain-containing protein [Chloroflexota bacterium]HUM69413.1 GatB/YqeY domain-containing protein [Chloroflexota bacterium]
MTLKEQLTDELKIAMRAGNVERRDTIRLLQAAIKQEEIDRQVTLDDTGVQAVLQKQAKQRRESIADYEKAGRPELAAEEQQQLTIIESFLPQMMSRDEVEQLARQVIADLGVTDVKEMGQVMGKLMPQVKGKADGRMVNDVVRSLIGNP